MMAKNDIEIIKKILIVRPDQIGDVVLTLPLCNQLKQYYPKLKYIIFVQPTLHLCYIVILMLRVS